MAQLVFIFYLLSQFVSGKVVLDWVNLPSLSNITQHGVDVNAVYIVIALKFHSFVGILELA